MTQSSPSSLLVKSDFSNATVYLWSNSRLLNMHMKPLLQVCLGLRKGPKQKQEQNEHKHHPSPFSILLQTCQNLSKPLDLWTSSCIKNLPLWIKLDNLPTKASVLIKTDIFQRSTRIENLIYVLAILRLVDEQQTKFSYLNSLIRMHFHYQKIVPNISRKSIVLKYFKFQFLRIEASKILKPLSTLWCSKMHPWTNLHLTNNTNFNESIYPKLIFGLRKWVHQI